MLGYICGIPEREVPYDLVTFFNREFWLVKVILEESNDNLEGFYCARQKYYSTELEAYNKIKELMILHRVENFKLVTLRIFSSYCEVLNTVRLDKITFKVWRNY